MKNFRSVFLGMKQSRAKLDHVLIVRVDPALTTRVDAALRDIPALGTMTRSEFTRRAILSAIEVVEQRKKRIAG